MFFKRQLLPVTDGCRETQDIFDCGCCSVNQSCLTLCNPMDFNTPGLSVPHHLPKFAQVDVHCISDAIHLSHPLTPSFPSAFNLFQHQGLFQWVSCSHQMTKLLAFQPQHQSFQLVFKGWFPLRLTGSILDSENSILWIRLQCRRPQFNSWVGKIHWRRDRLPTPVFLEFPCGSSSKESACNVWDLGSIPGLGRSPGEGNGYQLQYSGLENSMGSQRIRHDWVTFTSLYSVFRACLWSCLVSSFLSLLVSVPLPTNHFLFQQYFLINDLHSSSFLGLLLRKPDKNQPTHSSRTERLCSATERCQDLDSGYFKWQSSQFCNLLGDSSLYQLF